MRYSIDLLLCAALLFTGCKKDNVDVYTILSVYNRTEQHIKVISNIKSELCNSEQVFEMGPGEMVDISRSHYFFNYVVSGICRNTDAYFYIYVKTGDEYILTREWYFDDEKSEERNLFNPVFSSQHLLTDTDDLVEWNIIFTILPEDCENHQKCIGTEE